MGESYRVSSCFYVSLINWIVGSVSRCVGIVLNDGDAHMEDKQNKGTTDPRPTFATKKTIS